MILSDILMPEMDGFTLCRTMKHDPALRKAEREKALVLNSMSDLMMF